jgi:hypothetical protein
MTCILLILATFAASITRDFLIIAGGVFLKTILGFFLSITAAMELHRITSGFPNGSKVRPGRRHIKW